MKPTTAAPRLVNTRWLILLAATCFVALTIVGRVPRALAAAGDLDASFGTGGKVTTDSGFGGNDTGYAVIVQPDGKIVTAGQCLGSFCLVRENADGSLDDGGPDDSTPGDAFGVGGSVVTGFGTDTAAPTSMARQPDGKLVVLGSCGAVTTNVCIIRYNVDGSLDDGGPDDATPGDAFGTGGIVASTAGSAVGYAVALQTDGKIVVAGGCTGPDACVLRFNADGSFDDDGPDDSTPGDVFGTAGIAKTDFGTVIDQFNAVTIDQASGKIVAAGGCFFNGSLNFCIARFNPDGTLDSNSDADPTTHLGNTGAVTLDFGGADMAKAVAIQPADGKIVVAGRCSFNFLGSFCVGRLNTNGTIDTSFNASGAVPGIVITSFAASDDETLNALVIQPDGKLVGSGFCSSGACLARYNANGTLDTDSDADPAIHFNHTGKVTSATLVLAFALARQPTDGKLVAAGVCGGADHFDFCIARYDTQGAPDLTLGGTGFVTKDFGGGNDSGEAVVREPNDNVVVAGECNGKVCAARYDQGGDLDAAFGNGGLVTTDMPGGGGLVHGLVRQTDGKLVAAGTCSNHFCLVRWNADGSLDDGGANDSTPGDGAFGTAGIVVSIFASLDDARALLVQPDGKLVVAGGCGSTKIFCVARYNVNGSLDDGTVNDSTPGDAFGGAGRVSTNVAPGPETALAIARQPADGKLVVAGLCDNTSADDVCLVRYNVDGSVDSGVGNDSTPSDSFGTGGQVITNVGNVDTLGALALQTDGRIIAAGSSGFAKSFLVRYNVDGSLDDGGAGDATPGDSFGSGGKVLTDATPGNEGYSGLAIQPADGKIVAAGACGDASFTSTLCVARYTTGGVLDGTFGPGGLVTTPFFAKKNASATGVVLLSDERIVAAGRTLSPGRQNDFALARYLGNGLVTPTPSVTPAPTTTASRTPTPHATRTMKGGGGTPTSATATVTPVGPSATPTPLATRTPAPEDCSDCIDNDFDGAVDRADSDCPLPADGHGVGVGGPAAKAAVVCEKTIVKAGSTFALKRVKGLGACLQSAFACVEQKASDPACLAKAGAACAKAESARQTAVSKLTTSIRAKCDAPTFAAADLIAEAGLGFMDEQSGCMVFGVPLLQNATDVALCTAGRHACRAEALLGAAVPRARALLTLVGHDPAVEAPCLPPGGSGGASANGKGVVKCQKGIASAGAAYGGVQLGARQKCVAAVLACIQLKPGDGPCLAKAGATCSKLDTRIAAGSAKLTATIAKACGSPLALADVVGPLGVGFGLRDGWCQALGIPALDSTAAVAACVRAEDDCRVGQLLEGQTPRAGELRALAP